MSEIKGLTISESEYNLEDGKGKGKIAVFIYSGELNPAKVLDSAVHKYVENNGYNPLVDANLDNPWMRVILSDINNMPQEPFDSSKHKMKKSN